MADLPLELRDPELAARLALALDGEGKIPRALEALGPIAGRDVVLLDGDEGLRARQLLELGARLTVLERPERHARLVASLTDGPPGVVNGVGTPSATGLPDASADTIVACWSAFQGPEPAELGEAERILRPGGRLLIVHDYGRDDVSRLFAPDRPQYVSWSHRDGPFLRGGFKIRVIHCWWTFPSPDEAESYLRAAHGTAAEVVLADLDRPRLSYNVAVYHRTKGQDG